MALDWKNGYPYFYDDNTDYGKLTNVFLTNDVFIPKYTQQSLESFITAVVASSSSISNALTAKAYVDSTVTSTSSTQASLEAYLSLVLNSDSQTQVLANLNSNIALVEALVSSNTEVFMNLSSLVNLILNSSSNSTCNNALIAQIQNLLANCDSTSNTSLDINYVSVLYLMANSNSSISNSLGTTTNLSSQVDSDTSTSIDLANFAKLLANCDSTSLTSLELTQSILVYLMANSNSDINNTIATVTQTLSTQIDSSTSTSIEPKVLAQVLAYCDSTSLTSLEAYQLSQTIDGLYADSVSYTYLSLGGGIQGVKPVVLGEDGGLEVLPDGLALFSGVGVSGMVTLARITPTGEEGYISFINGIITGFKAPV